jgi:thioredoxin reductase (NADPH)
MLNYNVIIIGAGPAGMACALYLGRSKLKTLLIEKRTPGGRMLEATEIANFSGVKTDSGSNIAVMMFSQIDFNNVSFVQEEVIDIVPFDKIKVVTNSNEYICDKLVIATGFVNKPLGALNEERFVGRGISFCALCDAALTKGKNVLMYASNLKALEEASYLATLANKVYVICNEKLVPFVEKHDNMEFLPNYQIKSFNGMFKLQSVLLVNQDKELEINVDFAFLYNGYTPSSNFVKKLNIVDDLGQIIVNEDYETKIKNIYAIGDITNKKVKQVATAVGDGSYVGSIIVK